jgi:hypothetical protein
MIEAGAFVPHAEEGMVINIIIAGIDPTELTNDVVLVPGINVVRVNQTKCFAEPADSLPVLRRAEDGVANPFDTVDGPAANRMTSPERSSRAIPELIG